MFRGIRRRIDNANQMHKIRKENPEAVRRALEELAREQEIRENSPPAKPGPVIIFFRWFLAVLTVLIALIVVIGVPRSPNPVFSMLSFSLLLSIIYMVAGLANPAVIFFGNKWSRECILELFGLLIIVIVLLMAVFRP